MVLIRVLANLLILQLSYAQKSSELVIGGAECNVNEHRFLVALYDNMTGTLECSGTLIHPEWVLTAAHCDRETMVIYLGMHNKSINNDDQQRRSPREKYIFHCSECFATWDNDIMLIQLDSPVNNSTHIAPLSLPTSPPIIGSPCQVMGWGTITSPQETYPEVPHCANINLFSFPVCHRAFPRLWATSRILCAGVLQGGTDTCNHDSGGPLICNGQFQGIVCWGDNPCAQPRKPAIYTKVFYYLDWLQSIIAGNTTVTSPP